MCHKLPSGVRGTPAENGFLHIWGQKEAIWNTFFSINWFGHGILENQIQALSRTTSVLNDFPGLENLEKKTGTFKDPHDPCTLHWL